MSKENEKLLSENQDLKDQISEYENQPKLDSELQNRILQIDQILKSQNKYETIIGKQVITDAQSFINYCEFAITNNRHVVMKPY